MEHEKQLATETQRKPIDRRSRSTRRREAAAELFSVSPWLVGLFVSFVG
jgi:hypothetical protein